MAHFDQNDGDACKQHVGPQFSQDNGDARQHSGTQFTQSEADVQLIEVPLEGPSPDRTVQNDATKRREPIILAVMNAIDAHAAKLDRTRDLLWLSRLRKAATDTSV